MRAIGFLASSGRSTTVARLLAVVDFSSLKFIGLLGGRGFAPAVGYADALISAVGVLYRNGFGRAKLCPVNFDVMPRASFHIKRARCAGCRGRVGDGIGRARKGSRLRGLQATCD